MKKSSEFPPDRTERERRKNLTEEEIKELELAGGVEGGMQAGSAGGPSEDGAKSAPAKKQDGHGQ
jgi:hypothetical protein